MKGEKKVNPVKLFNVTKNFLILKKQKAMNSMLNCLKVQGPESLVKSEKVYGNGGIEIANVKYYRQLTPMTGHDAKTISLQKRVYTPGTGTRLNQMGIREIIKTRDIYGSTLQAHVILPNGNDKVLDGVANIKNFIKLIHD